MRIYSSSRLILPFIPGNLSDIILELPLNNDLFTLVDCFFPTSGNFSNSTKVRRALTTHDPKQNARLISHCCHVNPFLLTENTLPVNSVIITCKISSARITPTAIQLENNPSKMLSSFVSFRALI